MLCEYKLNRIGDFVVMAITLNGKRVANKMPEFDNSSWKDRKTVADISFSLIGWAGKFWNCYIRTMYREEGMVMYQCFGGVDVILCVTL